MPTISMFYGILIRMYNDDHNPPHFHASYGDNNGVFDFDGEPIETNLPKKQVKLIQAWAAIHKEELEANWQLVEQGEQVFKIEPLR